MAAPDLLKVFYFEKKREFAVWSVERTGMALLAVGGGVWLCRGGSVNGFPSFLPKEVERIRDPSARKIATRIERLPVQVTFSETSIMSSCVKPQKQSKVNPVVLLHGFDSSCLEWRYALPLLEDAGLETWAFDILGWGFSDLEKLPSCNVASKREHLYQFWRSYIRKPMILVGPSLGAAAAIDFAVNHPEAVGKLVLIDASVYAEGTGHMARLPKIVAYAGVSLLKSIPLRLYANFLTFKCTSFSSYFDTTKVGRLHCLLPWWEDATVDFMASGGYNVSSQIKKVKQNTLIIWGEDDQIVSNKLALVKQNTLIIWGEDDQIVSNKLALKLHHDLPNSLLHQIPNCGHIPHAEKPDSVAELIIEFARGDCDL